MLLVGDIGGTNARLALVAESSRGETNAEETFASRDYTALEEVLSDFLRRHGSSVDRAVFAVAGPVVDGVAELTNLGWHVNERALGKALGAKSVRIINDLHALAYGVPRLDAQSVRTLQHGKANGGTIAVLAPGTGLGEAFVTHGANGHHAYPSEGGHADFAPADDLQHELLAWLRRRYEHVSYERVCSGSGIPNLFDFLEQRGGLSVEKWLSAQLAAAPDPTPVIVDAGTATGRCRSELCAATLELFARILAAEAGNAALRFMATGGVYLGGSLVQKLLPIIEQPFFLEVFSHKGRLADLMQQVPLHIITHPNAALFGAIQFALTDLSSRS